ncbi:hypothetical protein PCE1_004466 [Barthelona sp. PCE]
MTEEKRDLTENTLESEETADFVVDPWKVEGEVDYDKLVKQFGSELITEEIIERLEALTGRKAHPWIRRGLFFSHRDLSDILDAYERGEPFYLYTGRGPSSSSLHLGHMIPMLMTQWLQEVFNVPLTTQITDDEKSFWKDLTLDECTHLGIENSKDIIACGFDPERTFIFLNTDYVPKMYRIIREIRMASSYSDVRKIFGFDDDYQLAQATFPSVQSAPAFSSAFPLVLRDLVPEEIRAKAVASSKKKKKKKKKKKRNAIDVIRPDDYVPIRCLVPCAIDQDNYFRYCRDVAPKLREMKPALIHSKFLPSLFGRNTKMSASSANTTIWMDTTREQLEATIRTPIDPDACLDYLRFFVADDEELEAALEMPFEQQLDVLIDELWKVIEPIQARRATVTNETVREFMVERPLKGPFSYEAKDEEKAE